METSSIADCVTVADGGTILIEPALIGSGDIYLAVNDDDGDIAGAFLSIAEAEQVIQALQAQIAARRPTPHQLTLLEAS